MMSTQPYGVDGEASRLQSLDPDSEVQADTTIDTADVTGIDWDQEREEITQASEKMEIAEPEVDAVENLPPSRFVKASWYLYMIMISCDKLLY